HPSVSSQPSFHPHLCPSLHPWPLWDGPRSRTCPLSNPSLPSPGVAEMEKLKDTFSNVIFSLEQKGMAKVPYQVAVPKAVVQIQPELAQLKP
ncbi:hypothetical protein G0U57_021402, partial [Chelydra serpentina]